MHQLDSHIALDLGKFLRNLALTLFTSLFSLAYQLHAVRGPPRAALLDHEAHVE